MFTLPNLFHVLWVLWARVYINLVLYRHFFSLLCEPFYFFSPPQREGLDYMGMCSYVRDQEEK